MLACVSHICATILTRFQLERALIATARKSTPCAGVEKMSGMAEDYLAFARGDSG